MTDAFLKALRYHYGAYYLAMNTSYESVWFQQQILGPILEQVVLGKVRRLMVLMPFRHAKSDLVTINFPSFYFGHWPEKTIISLSYNHRLAAQFGRQVRTKMQSELYVKLFPKAKISYDSRAKDHFSTVTGGRYFAAGFDGTVNGLGANCLIIDDPLKNAQEATSEATREFHHQLYNSTIRTRLEPGAPIIIVTTRWSPLDLVGWRIQEDGAWDILRNRPYIDPIKDVEGKQEIPNIERKPGMWNVVSLEAIANEDSKWRKMGEALWPSRYPVEELDKIRQADPMVWEACYQQRPTLGGGCWFDRSWIQYYEHIEPKKLNLYMIVDPALKKHTKADYTTILIVGAGADRNYYWVDCIHDRMDPAERADAIFRMHRKWKPVSVAYEEYGLQSDTAALRERMERDNYRFTVTVCGRSGAWHQVSKGDRIRTLIPVFRDGRIWLPNPETRGRDGGTIEQIRDLVEREIVRYPAVDYDDYLDALSRINDPAVTINFPMSNDIEVPRMDWRGATWMSG